MSYQIYGEMDDYYSILLGLYVNIL